MEKEFTEGNIQQSTKKNTGVPEMFSILISDLNWLIKNKKFIS